MKLQQARLIWAIILASLFGIIAATFCYFLGTTDTLGHALGAFGRYGIGLIPIFLAVVILAFSSLRRIGKKEKG